MHLTCAQLAVHCEAFALEACCGASGWSNASGDGARASEGGAARNDKWCSAWGDGDCAGGGRGCCGWSGRTSEDKDVKFFHRAHHGEVLFGGFDGGFSMLTVDFTEQDLFTES